ncbi:MAG: substrate-binding domain-containing protein [Acidimicrobiales bacterium]|jgi:ribose transport system substrate-binding protein
MKLKRRVRPATLFLAAFALGSGLVLAVAQGSGAASSSTITATAAYEIAHAGILNTTAFCGTKKITLGIEDGYGINSWSQASFAAVRSEAAKCSNVTQDVEAAGGSLPTMISQIKGMANKGDQAIVVIPDDGQAELPAIEYATQHGVKVVPWAANPGGKAPADYVAYVDWNPGFSGTLFANWMVTQLHGHGNVVELGGPAGNPVSAEELAAVVKVFKAHPGMKLLTGDSTWAVTDWTSSIAAQVTASLLAKYPTINGIISDYGTDVLAALNSFQAANRALPAVGVPDANGLGCLWIKVHKSQKQFQMITDSTRNWMGRVAARKAIAAAEGIKDTEPNLYNLTPFENSTGSLPPRCDPKQPADRYLSDQLTPQVIAEFGKTN